MVGNRTVINILLGLAVTGLAGYLIYTTDDRPDGPAYTGIDPAAINRITIAQSEQPPVVFAKQAGGWRLERPFRIHANRLRINSILGLTRTPANSSFTSRGADLDKLGLGDGALTLLLNDHEFMFGNTDPINDRRYVKYQNTVYLVEDNLYFQLRQDAPFFAGTKLVPDNSRIIQLMLPQLTLIRDGTRWVSIPADAVSGDEAALLAERWQHAEATTVSSPSEFNSLGTVTIHLKDETPVTFDVVSLAPALILARTDPSLQYFMGNYRPEHLGLGKLPVTAASE